MLFIIEINGVIYHEQPLDRVYSLREQEGLIIIYEQKRYTYADFSKLSCIRKPLLRLEVSDNIRPDSDSEDSGDPSVKLQKLNNMDQFTFLKFAASLVHPYSGTTDGLEAFITNVNLVSGLADTAIRTSLFQFVKGRLTGKAATVCSGCTTVTEIVAALQENILRDPSEVLESRLTALNFDNKGLTDFCVEVEKIADSLLDSLVAEGVSRPKANSMTIDKVIRVCRKSANNETTRAVLAATSYKTPKDVLSKFRTEISECAHDQQILAFQRQRNNNQYPNYRTRRSFPPNSNYNNNNYGQNRQFNNNNSRQFNSNNRSNYNNNNYNNRPNYNNNNNDNNRSSHPNVRVLQESENSEPSVRWPAEQQQQ